MNQHTCGATFDYVLSLNGVEPTEFVNWTTECQMRDFSGKLLAIVESQWINPAAPVALALFEIDTSKWRPGVALMDVRFIGPDGYIRTLQEPIQWELTR